ncbi:MAG: ATP-dependent Clp protease proteolytic subunit [Parvularculaceae bacterium]|nr:ATP-dependent Clp protease proteolytic subunit [Parvularculaceae bacterium]
MKASLVSWLRGAWLAALVAAGASLLAGAVAQEGEAQRKGVILTLDGPVTPASAAYLAREIGAASDQAKELVIIEIDTPGGLVDSMKTIIKAILASETPVATYVSPQGARSASAGFYIMYAAHVSAMAPSTNTGAATPVEIGGAPSDDDSFKDAPTPKNPDKDAQPTDEGATRAAEEAGRAIRDIRPTSAPEA